MIAAFLLKHNNKHIENQETLLYFRDLVPPSGGGGGFLRHRIVPMTTPGMAFTYSFSS